MVNQPPALTYDKNTYIHVSSKPNFHPRSFTVTSQSPEPHHQEQEGDGDNSSTESPECKMRGLTNSTISTVSTVSSVPSDDLIYVGLVGELENEHIYYLPKPTTNPPDKDVIDVKKWLQALPGVKTVDVMIPRKRHKPRVVC